MARRWSWLAAALALAAAAASLPAEAGSRPDARAMSCAAAQGLVARNGAVVMTTGPQTYERFVATLGSCIHGQILRPAYTATADDPQCSIGWTCEEYVRRLRIR